MRRTRRIARLALLLVGLGSTQGSPSAAAPAAAASRWEWTGVDRVVALGDLHGSFDKLVALLEGTGLTDGGLHWSGGDDHLVVAGDFLDRGPRDRPLMELLMRLESESEAAGGRVHVLLGNHEAMNLQRDLRKVHPHSYRDFADEESSAERQAAFRRFTSAGMANRSLRELTGEFQRRFPRGFFARQRLLEPDGRYGSWLLSLPAVVKINGVVYLHGGLTEEVAELGLDGINERLASALRSHLAARAALEGAGATHRAQELRELRSEAERILEGATGDAELEAAARSFVETADHLLLGGGGPLWYRGTSLEDERIERRQVETALDLLDARVMVVAHSYTGGNRITSRFQGRLYRLDHGILESKRPLALIVEGDEPVVLNLATRSRTVPVRELPPGGVAIREAPAIGDHELEQFLTEAEVVDSRELGRGSTRPRLLVLARNGEAHRAIHKMVEEDGTPGAVTNGDRYRHEVAAYRVDRLLGLRMVPVTVLRTIDGAEGSLQTWIEEAVDQQAAADYDLALWKPEASARQLARASVFDALIGNPDRQPSDILCPLKGQNFYLIDHSKAFATSTELPDGDWSSLVRAGDLAGPLEELDRRTLAAELGGLLSAPQIDALLERRDRILESARAAERLSTLSAGPGSQP